MNTDKQETYAFVKTTIVLCCKEDDNLEFSLHLDLDEVKHSVDVSFFVYLKGICIVHLSSIVNYPREIGEEELTTEERLQVYNIRSNIVRNSRPNVCKSFKSILSEKIKGRKPDDHIYKLAKFMEETFLM